MKEFWENKFREVRTMWGMQPADSAIRAKDIFLEHKIKDILIPGVGYGRNAVVFLENGIKVTGIELSEFAINMARNELKLDFPVFQGSVTAMPYDHKKYGGIFCYALIHLLNKNERRQFIRNCFHQLKPGGVMIFVAISVNASIYGNGRLLSTSRFEMEKGLKVFFYDPVSASKEFSDYGLLEVSELDEPVRFKENEPPLKFIFIQCCKQKL
jgi:SAM-dependent methyltransferase